MRANAIRVLWVTACLSFGGVSSWAQEGHPLSGTWHGDWALGGTERHDLTVIMDWDGKQVTGLVNPVTDRASLIDAKLDSSHWTAHFAVDLKDGSGKVRHCVADGKLEHLGSDRRTLTGRWICGTEQGEFQLVRDRDY